MKKLIIFSGATGGGHNQIANNIRQEFEEQDYQVIIKDILCDYNHFIKAAFVDSYDFLYRKAAPIYGAIYSLSDNRVTSKTTGNILSLFLKHSLAKFIIKEKPDAILSVHPFGSGILGKMREEGIINCPLTVLVTDFQVHGAHIAEGVDKYLVSSEYTKTNMIKRGVDPKKIIVSGIPVDRKFHDKVYVSESNIFRLLIMDGSDGAKIIKPIAKYLEFCKNMQITVVCGKNKSLEQKLKKKYEDFDNITILGFTDKVSQLMSRADLIVTKPGATTIAEAISQELPIAIPYSIPGHERANAKFLVEHGVAIRTFTYPYLIYAMEKLAENPQYITKMKQQIRRMSLVANPGDLVNQIENN